ncbi:MAG: hypothetical protein IT304_04880 [Dehalococcoidia bacterium]|nr:hypothetical protein [Dehalococcoidia bacterium]
MTLASVRYLEKFESVDGLMSYAFPVDDYEYEPSQAFRRAEAPVVGADYAVDFLGAAPWPKAVGEEALRFTIWGTSAADADGQFDDSVTTLRRIGLGKLYQLDSVTTRRWCWAKLLARPSYQVDVNGCFNVPVTLRFARYSDWFAAAPTTGSVTITTSPYPLTITNPGNAPARFAVFRLRANAASGFTNPSLTNLTNGYSFASSRDAVSVDSELKVDTERMQVLWSDTNGAVYADDYALVTLGPTQVGFMQLEPGPNAMQYADGGVPNLDLEWSFYAPYH